MVKLTLSFTLNRFGFIGGGRRRAKPGSDWLRLAGIGSTRDQVLISKKQLRPGIIKDQHSKHMYSRAWEQSS